MKKLPKRILVVVLDNLGDTVMAAAIFRPLKRLFPLASLGVWVKKYAKGLFVDHSLIDAVHASDPFWDKSPGAGRGSFSDFMRVVFEVRRARYDAAIVLNAEWRRASACMFARIPQRIGTNRRESASFLTHAFPPPPVGQHFVDDHRQLLEMWAKHGVALDDCVPRLEVSEAEREWWLKWSAGTGLSARPFNVAHLYSGDERKNWPLASWAKLIQQRLATHPNEKFVLVCGPGEQHRLEAFMSGFDRSSVIPMPAPELGQLKAVLKSAKIFVGGDSGPGHVAAALGTPVVSLFGPTPPERCRPLGYAAVRVLQKEPLADLPVEDVLTSFNEILSRGQKTTRS